MTGLMVNICLLALLVAIVVMVMRTHRLFAVVVLSGAYSLICAVVFINLDAVDVAFTEAAVGAGISTVLFLAAMAVLPANEKQLPGAHTLTSNLAALVIVLIVGGLLIHAAFDLPALGDPNAPARCMLRRAIFGKRRGASYPECGDDGTGKLSRLRHAWRDDCRVHRRADCIFAAVRGNADSAPLRQKMKDGEQAR